jgi:hypothetical protein
MSVLYLKWDLRNTSQEKIERYCRQCGRVVSFEDSFRRRQNANGKDIHEYAIYKCEKGHTWNKKIQTMKAYPGIENLQKPVESLTEEIQEIHCVELLQAGITLIQIDIEYVDKRQRLDVTLSSRIKDISRSTIQKWIRRGVIQVNGLHVSSNYFIRTKDTITILVRDIPQKKEVTYE